MPNVTREVLNNRDIGNDCSMGTVRLLHGTDDEFYNSFFKAACDILVSLHDEKTYFPLLYVYVER
jgi:hypothetical protein